MDKYEYNLKLDQIKTLYAEENYDSAAEIADTINWNKIRNVNALVKAGEVYEKVERYQDSRDVLLMAYDRSPIGRMIIYRLAEVAIKMKDFSAAEEYYNEFVEIAPHDNLKYVLKYDIQKSQGASYDVLIPILEDFKDQEYTEEWAYELAYLYHKSGKSESCIEACDELILWFGDGPYVERALELKMLYQPLTKIQEEKYRKFRQEKAGLTVIGAEEMKKAGEIERESVAIPPIAVPAEKFSTVNLQQEIAKGMQQIMAATEKETVSDTMDSIKKIVEEIPYLQIERETEKQETIEDIVTDEEIDGSLKIDFQEMLEEESDGQLSLLTNDRLNVERQITGQISIEDVLEEWEKTRRAAEAALQAADQRKLESAKARALHEAEDIMERLNDVIPKLDAGVTPKELLEEEYLQKTDTVSDQNLFNQSVLNVDSLNINDLNTDSSNANDLSIDSLNTNDLNIDSSNTNDLNIDSLNTDNLYSGIMNQDTKPLFSIPSLNIPPVDRVISEMGKSAAEAINSAPAIGLGLAGVSTLPNAPFELGIESTSVETTPVETASIETTPIETTPIETASIETTPIETASIETASIETTPIGSTSIKDIQLESPSLEVEEQNKISSIEGVSVESEAPEIPIGFEEITQSVNSIDEQLLEVELDEAIDEAIELNLDKTLNSENIAPETVAEPEFVLAPETVIESEVEETLGVIVEPEVELNSEENIAQDIFEKSTTGLFKPIDIVEDLKLASQLDEVDEKFNRINSILENQVSKISEEDPEIGEKLAIAATQKLPTAELLQELGMFDNKQDEVEVKVEKLTEEQKAMFSYFIPVKGMEKQLSRVVSRISNHLTNDDTATRGNLIVQGEQGCGKTVLATCVIKVLQNECQKPGKKIGKIPAASINGKDLHDVVSKVAGGTLIIESAGDLDGNTAKALAMIMERDKSGTLYVLEDTSVGIKKALSCDENFARKFTEKISVPIFTNDELVAFARSYSRELGYEIEEMAVLALHNRISNIEKLDQATTLTEVKEIVDEAIKREAKLSLHKYFSILTAKRYTTDDKIVLTEREFE